MDSSVVRLGPKNIAILGLGPSLGQFLEITKRMGGASALFEEVWGINAVGDCIRCDRIFHMDDVRIQEIRAAAAPDSNIANMLRWLKCHPGPIYTSRTHPEYPGLVPFPLEDVITGLGNYYFNSTAAYALAFALHIGVEQISIFGCDFTYANAHHAERGRACMEYWLGVALARGIKTTIAGNSSLMDGCDPEETRGLYGYDTLDVKVAEGEGGRAIVTMTEKAELPTAGEIERRYDHSAHPNPLVAAADKAA